ncbi:MAG: DUF4240 domain-containing protein [Myxococcales bacterium]|nr:DUF4240 domain-containing protein [Myxococcales bacterium]
MERLECTAGTSRKFWECAVVGRELRVWWGRIDTVGKRQTKVFATPAAARAAAAALVRAKLAKGYTTVKAGARRRPPPAAPPPTGPMTEAVFWALIATFDWKRTGDDDAVLRHAVRALAAMTVDDIYAFDDLLAAKLFALDTRAVARGVYRGELDPDDGDAYISADDFLYTRCVIVANGRAFYDRVLADPHTAPQGLEFESLLYVAADAYAKKTGDEYDHAPPLSKESFSNRAGWKPTAATRPGRATSAAVPPGNRRPARSG